MAVSTADVTANATNGTNVTTLTTPSFTITSNASVVGVIAVDHDNAVTSETCSMGGVSGVAITGTTYTGTIIGHSGKMYSVIAPPSGSQTATASWTTAVSSTLSAMATSGVDQTTPANNGTSTFASGTAGSLAITSTSGDLTVDQFVTDSTSVETTLNANQTLRTNVAGTFSRAASTSTGLGTGSQTHTWTGHGTGWVMSACNLVQAAAIPDAIGSANLTSSAGRFIGWTT